MLTNITTVDSTNTTVIPMTPEELALKRVIESNNAAWALEKYLDHTPEEAAVIVNDPVYTLRDLSLIKTISEMLRSDLLFSINSFFEDEEPTEPTCKQICERMVERFPIEPMVMNPNGNNPTIYENAVNISRGLVRRLLRAKAFRQTCEDTRIAAVEYYRSVAILETSMDDFSFNDTAVQLTFSTDNWPANFSFHANTIVAPRIRNIEQANLQEILFMVCFFSAVTITTYNILLRPGIRRNLGAAIGFFKQPFRLNRFEQEGASQLHKPVNSWRKALSNSFSIFTHCSKSRPAPQPLDSQPSFPAP
jgi:hypothetical protein